MMTIALESMAVAMPEVEGHPNRAAFRGVLTVVDAPSQRSPSGRKGIGLCYEGGGGGVAFAAGDGVGLRSNV